MFTRFNFSGFVALVAMFTAVNLAEAKGFGGGGGGSGGGTKSFAQKFFNNNPAPKTTTIQKTFVKQDSNPTKSFSKDCKNDKCHDKCCYHRSHYCYDYGYCGWGICDDFDLQVIGVQMLDSGNPAGGIGPTFRVTFRNNSFVSINRPFSLSLIAIVDPTSGSGIPGNIRVRGIGAFQTAAVDIRMPIEAMRPGLAMMQAVVDSHREVREVNESNNAMLVKLAEVRPVAAAERPVATTATEAAPALSTDEQAAIASEPMADEQGE